MASTFDAKSTASGSGVTSVSWTHTPVGTPTAVGVGCYSYSGTGTISGITYGGAAMAQAVRATDTTPDECVIYGKPNPASGAQTVSISASGAFYPGAVAWSALGSDTGTTFSNTASNSGTVNSGGSINGGTCNSSASEFVVACMGADAGGGTLTIGGTGTEDMNFVIGGEVTGGAHAAGSATVTISFTTSAGTGVPWCGVSASFKVASAGGFNAGWATGATKTIGGVH